MIAVGVGWLGVAALYYFAVGKKSYEAKRAQLQEPQPVPDRAGVAVA